MNTNLLLVGEINFLKEQSYEGTTTYKLQFLIESDTKGLSIIEVKLDERQDISILGKGVKVQVPVSITAMDRKIYYKQNGKISVK